MSNAARRIMKAICDRTGSPAKAAHWNGSEHWQVYYINGKARPVKLAPEMGDQELRRLLDQLEAEGCSIEPESPTLPELRYAWELWIYPPRGR